MIISRTPFRVSFLGGGTDYPDWYRAEGGAVLSTAIDKYCYITCRRLPPFLGFRHRVVWRHIETVNSAAEILHPAVRAGLPYLGFDDSQGLEIHHQGDLPTRTGLGSSSAFSVGLIKALLALRGEDIDPRRLATMAIDFEHHVLKEAVGSQDQIAAAFGGLNVIRFRREGGFEVEPLDVPEPRLCEFKSHLLLLYAGTERLASTVAAQVIANLGDNRGVLRRMSALADEGAAVLSGDGTLSDFGELLHEGWTLKKSLADVVSTPTIDRIYEEAREAGAIGGKLLGAGSAGCMLLFVHPSHHNEVREALRHVMWVPIGIDTSGSTIIYNDERGAETRAAAGQS